MKSLNEQLGVDTRTVAALSKTFGLKPTQAEIVGYMMRREYAHPECLYTVLYGALPECQKPGQHTFLCHVIATRTAMRKHGFDIIDIGDEMGWYIKPADKRLMRLRMAEAGVTNSTSPARARGRARYAYGVSYA